MAQLSPADQEKLNKLIEEGKKLAKQLGDELSSASLDNINNDLNIAERLVQGLRDEWKEYTSDVAGSREGFTRIVDELKNMNSGAKLARSSFKGLASLAQKLQSHQEGISKLSSKEIANLKKQSSERTNDLKLAGKLAKDQIRSLETRNNLSNKEQKQLEEARAAHANITQEITENIGFIKQFEAQLDESGKKAKNLEDALGLGGNALKGMQDAMGKLGLGGLADKLGLDEAQEAMDEMAAKLTNNGENAATLGNKFKILGAGMKSAFSGLAKNLLDPKVLIAEFVTSLQSADEATGKLAKDFNLTYSEALATRRELSNMATMSGDVALNARALQESMVAVGQSLGTNAKLNEADLATFTKLREQAGYTNEELVGIQKLSLVNGKTLEDNTKEILGGAEAYATRNGLVVNEKDVLREVSKASASLKLSLGGSAKAVAEAAVQAKQFGLNLEQAEKISQSLLQFESSIENELSAELLTGKELNFEKARSLALEGKTAEAAAEIAKQVGTSADFGKMNVLQQEAIAKAAGMERDELAQSLIDKESLAKIGFKDAAAAKAKYEELRKTMSAQEASKALGDAALATQYEQQSVQERFAQATEKLKEVFISLAEPVLAFISPIVDLVSSILPLVNIVLQPVIFTVQTLASLFTSIKNLITESVPGLITFGTVLAGILLNQQRIAFAQKEGWMYSTYEYAMKKKELVLTTLATAKEVFLNNIKQKGLLKSIAEAAMTAFKSVASIPIVGPLLGAAAAASAVALGYSLMKGDDVISPGDGSSGYGKRTLFGPEGAIQLNNKDTVIAGTDLFKKGDDVMSAPKGAITVANSTSPRSTQNQDPSAGTNARLDALISATTKVNAIPTLKIQ
jgi:hypothetical protein